MARPSALVALVASLALLACTGQVTGPGGTPDASADGTTPPPDGTTLPDGAPPPTDSSTSDSSTTDTGTPPFDAGACSATTLADALTLTLVGGSSSANRVFGAPTSADGAVAAWSGGDGVHVVTLDGSGATIGSEVTVPGERPYGLAIADDGTIGLLVNRGMDALYLVALNADGSSRFEQLLIGEVDHGVTDNEWFGTGIRDGRLTWTGSQWAAYYTLQRLWNDGVAHYGDQLRLVNADGTSDRNIWGWGCSHSMEVRLAHDGSSLGPLCASDCFPDKGVFFNHRTMLHTDSRANCSGGYSAHLGGVAPMASGFVVAFTAGDGRGSEDVATARIDGSGSAAETVFLTDAAGDETAPNIAPFDSGVIVGWVSGSASMLQRVSPDGTGMGAAESVPSAGLAEASDFFAFTNGDAGWIVGGRGGVSLARLRDCN